MHHENLRGCLKVLRSCTVSCALVSLSQVFVSRYNWISTCINRCYSGPSASMSCWLLQPPACSSLQIQRDNFEQLLLLRRWIKTPRRSKIKRQRHNDLVYCEQRQTLPAMQRTTWMQQLKSLYSIGLLHLLLSRPVTTLHSLCSKRQNLQ